MGGRDTVFQSDAVGGGVRHMPPLGGIVGSGGVECKGEEEGKRQRWKGKRQRAKVKRQKWEGKRKRSEGKMPLRGHRAGLG